MSLYSQNAMSLLARGAPRVSVAALAVILTACSGAAPPVAPASPTRAPTAVPTPPVAPTPTHTAAPPRRVNLVVATVSMTAAAATSANLQRFEQFMSEAAGKGAHLIVFPEDALQQNPGWGTQSDKPTPQEIEYVARTAETIPGESTARLAALAQKFGLYVVFGMTERASDGELYNASVLLGPDGVLGSYRKNTLWDSSNGGNEHHFWARGDEAGKVIGTPIGKIGLMTCIEMAFSYGKKLAEKGADLIVTVSGWPENGGTYYDSFVSKNAVACNCWHVVSNQVGAVGYGSMYGHSVVINPKGEVMSTTGAKEGMVVTETGYQVDSRALPTKVAR